MAAPEGTAYISEHVEFDDRGPVATGLFDCELRGEEDEWLGVYAEPPLELPEALAWGRSRAERVIVRIDNDFFSAGVADGSHPRLDESRQFTRRRPAGWGSLDLTEADPPISWHVLLQLDTRSAGLLATDGAPLAAGERWRDALNQLRTVAVVEIATIRGLGPIRTGGRLDGLRRRSGRRCAPRSVWLGSRVPSRHRCCGQGRRDR